MKASVHHNGVLSVEEALALRSPRRSFVASGVRRHPFAALRLVPVLAARRAPVAVDDQLPVVLAVFRCISVHMDFF